MMAFARVEQKAGARGMKGGPQYLSHNVSALLWLQGKVRAGRGRRLSAA